MSRKYLYSIIALLGILVLAVMLKTPLTSKAMMNILPGLRATKEHIDPDMGEIKAFEAELQRTDLSSEARNLITEKLNTIALMATQRAVGLANRPTRPAFIVATPTMEFAGFKLPDGIDDHPSVPISESVVTIFNSWRKTTAERYFLVYAGVLTQDSQQGAVLVLHPSTHDFKQFNTPTKSGGVRVVEENGLVITLQSTKGILFYFDAFNEQFMDINGKPIPTNEPISPTSVPIISSTQIILPAYP